MLKNTEQHPSRKDVQHLLKAIGFGVFRYGTPLLPVIGGVVTIWVGFTSTPAATMRAFIGVVTGVMALSGIPEIDQRMRRHYSIYKHRVSPEQHNT